MFTNKEAPFFHFAHPWPLPVLGEDYALYLVGLIGKRTQKKVNQAVFDQAKKAFRELHGDALYYRRLIESLPSYDDWDFHSAMARLRDETIPEWQGYAEQWNRLHPLEQAIIRALASGENRIYARNTLESLAREMGQSISTSQVQAAVKRLLKQGVLVRDTSSLQLEDDEFGQWALQG